ncbi:MAG: hypothetical protein K2L89_08955 [Muribaculaceae bacterium]|nr:hypothetical protein [Muribaculaceae bacterium]
MVNNLVDGINRYREESRIREDRERRHQISEENREMERKERRENRIDAQLIGPDDSEEIIYQKLSKLDKMFQKQLNDFDDELVTRILQTYEDNLEILEDRFPNQKITANAAERLESIRQRKQDYHKTARKKSILTFILLILVIGAIYLLDKFDIFSFISPYRLKP